MMDDMVFLRSNPILVISLVALSIGTFLLYRDNDPTSQIRANEVTPQSVDTLILGNETFAIEIAKDRDAQVKGLSGRPSIPADQGMLFWFLSDGTYPFWMPDMFFSIDILWIDSNWNIVHIEEGVSPESYPATFESPVPARYVLEVASGTIARLGVKKGQKIDFHPKAP